MKEEVDHTKPSPCGQCQFELVGLKLELVHGQLCRLGLALCWLLCVCGRGGRWAGVSARVESPDRLRRGNRTTANTIHE